MTIIKEGATHVCLKQAAQCGMRSWPLTAFPDTTAMVPPTLGYIHSEHFRLGCMLAAYGSEQKFLDLQFHLQQAAKAYHANKWILEDRTVPISQRLRYFDSVVSSVACFAGGQRTIYKEHIQTLDPHFRKFCRSIVGPPPHIDWTLEWHEVLHTWNERAALFFSLKHTELVPNLLWCVLETGCSHCQTSHSSLDTESFALATCGAWAAKTPLGQQSGDVLSLPKIGSLGRTLRRTLRCGSNN